MDEAIYDGLTFIELDKEELGKFVDEVEKELVSYHMKEAIVFNGISPRGVALMMAIKLMEVSEGINDVDSSN